MMFEVWRQFDVEGLLIFLQQRRQHYARVGHPLSTRHKDMLWPYFSPGLLSEVRLVELRGDCLANLEVFEKAGAQDFTPPRIAQMGALTFIDVVVFSHEIDEESLFHALVHAVQIRVLGLRRYAELLVQSFIQTNAQSSGPLEIHAFSLTSRFLCPAERFCVEDHVLRWVIDCQS
jgi:hypothetical protein